MAEAYGCKGRFGYCVRIKCIDTRIELRTTIFKWCDDNCGFAKWGYDWECNQNYLFYFNEELDAVAFKLRWV